MGTFRQATSPRLASLNDVEEEVERDGHQGGRGDNFGATMVNFRGGWCAERKFQITGTITKGGKT